jgi:formamidase
MTCICIFVERDVRCVALAEGRTSPAHDAFAGSASLAKASRRAALKFDLLPTKKIGFASPSALSPGDLTATNLLKEWNMNGLGGLNKSPEGVVIGLVQLQLPVVVTRQDLARQTDRIVYMVGKARRNLATMDLVVFPEYALHGLSMDTNPEIMCRLDGPEVAAFKKACVDNHIWGCFSIMEFNPDGNPYNSGLIIDDHGQIKLYYRKFHPWIPVEPWEPGDIGIPVVEGPKGAKIALIICHDGMFPEMARECAYKGAEIMIRTAGYTAPIRESWRFTNQANAFQNLMVTANVCMCGSDGSFDSMGEGMIVNFDGSIIAHGTTGRADEIITAEVRPDLVREARIHWASKTTSTSFGIAATSR